MKLFRRKDKNEVLPDEVQDYYRTEQRDRMGMAWLLAAGGLILTVAIVVGLFYGGRWAYQNFFTDTNGVDTITSEVDNDDSNNDTNGLPGITDEADDSADAEPDTDTATDVEPDTASPAVGEGAELPRTGPATQE